MPGYNRVRGIQWPVTFTIEDGRRFTVEAPERSSDGAELEMRLMVEDENGAVDYVVSPIAPATSAGGVIGRTLRWWWETRHESVNHAKPAE
jgi:hypothetical protein